MAFRKKASIILNYKPDILIVPECEYPDKLKFLADEIGEFELWSKYSDHVPVMVNFDHAQ